MSRDGFDYSGFADAAAPKPGDNLMRALEDLATQQQMAEQEVERLEKLLEEAQATLKRISEHEIPNLLDGMNGKLKLPDGRAIEVTETVRSGATKDKKPLAINWMDKNGHGAMIKRQFILEFGRDQEPLVKKFEEFLRKFKEPLNIKKERSIHHATLEAFVRQCLKDGEEIPLDIFSVYRQKKTKIVSDV